MKSLEKVDYKNILNSTNIYFHTDKNITKSITEIKATNDVNIFVWPEWGFDESEINNFEENNFIPATLWENILRCETAAIVSWFAVKNFCL